MKDGLRLRVLEGAAILGLLIVAQTEVLSLTHKLTRAVALGVWIPATLFAIMTAFAHRARITRLFRPRTFSFDERLAVSAIALICAVNLFLALIAAPSALDALSYHAPRISHWIQNASVEPYPTHIDRQIWIGPGAEVFALQLQLVFGTDRFMNIVQCLSFAGCVILASELARELGASRIGQIFAAFAAATVPMAIAEASGSQVDVFASFWMAASVVLLLRLRRTLTITIRSAIMLGACIGLSVLAKGTTYAILLPFILWCSLSAVRRLRLKTLAPALVTIAVALGINAGHYARTYEVFGNPFTNPRAPRLVNDIVTPAVIISNVVRNIAAHTSSRVAVLNEIQQSAIVSVHSALGLNESDTRTSFSNSRFRIVKSGLNEEWGANPLHLGLLVSISCLLLLTWRSSPSIELGYVASLLAGFLLFCIVFKWQPWISRLHLPFFVIGAGLIGSVLERTLSLRWLRALGVVIFFASMPILLRNQMRPLISRSSILSIPRERRYFIETRALYEPSVAAADLLSRQNCRRIGLITSSEDHEELLWVVLRNRIPGPFEIHHILVTADEYPPVSQAQIREPTVCAVVTQFAPNLAQREELTVPPGFSLALNRGPVNVYLPYAVGIPVGGPEKY